MSWKAWLAVMPPLLGIAYIAAALHAVRRFTRRQLPERVADAAVSVMKPLCGADPELLQNLRSFRDQDHDFFQIVCGVRDPADPALDAVRQAAAERPARDIVAVVDPRCLGANLKVSNLENMLPRARHGCIVIADSDIRVTPSYLSAVTAPLADPTVGLVTCLYTARAAAGPWSRLAAMHVNYGFLPAALLGDALRPGQACFGATMALHRDTLKAVGGFSALRDRLADDHELGAAVRRCGAAVVLSSYLVETLAAERGLAELLAHELRWVRTIRSVTPAGFCGLLITNPLALAAGGAALSGLAAPALLGLAAVLACRLAMVRAIERMLGLERVALWLVPWRDLLSLAVFLGGCLGRTVVWRGGRFRLDARGDLVLMGEANL
jgi:ceramide glucosyltransferase